MIFMNNSETLSEATIAHGNANLTGINSEFVIEKTIDLKNEELRCVRHCVEYKYPYKNRTLYDARNCYLLQHWFINSPTG